MAKVRNNVAVRGISGSIGGMVFRQMPDGSTTISQKPDFSKRKFSKGQKDHQARVKQAAEYARDAAKRYPIYAELAKGTGKSPYNFAFGDWFNPPVIHNIEKAGQTIRLQASDDVMVAKVEVRISDDAGNMLTKGQAIQTEADTWEFVTDAIGKATVKVWDLAGNITQEDLDQ